MNLSSASENSPSDELRLLLRELGLEPNPELFSLGGELTPSSSLTPESQVRYDSDSECSETSDSDSDSFRAVADSLPSKMGSGKICVLFRPLELAKTACFRYL